MIYKLVTGQYPAQVVPDRRKTLIPEKAYDDYSTFRWVALDRKVIIEGGRFINGANQIFLPYTLIEAAFLPRDGCSQAPVSSSPNF